MKNNGNGHWHIILSQYIVVPYLLPSWLGALQLNLYLLFNELDALMVRNSLNGNRIFILSHIIIMCVRS